MEIKCAAIGSEGGHLAGRKLLQTMYEARFQKPMPRILTTRQGKPYFEDSSIFFSISHTKDHVFCVLSSKPVGLDAEKTDRIIRPELADKILSPSEKDRYMQASDKKEALLRFWVLKEAATKCTGEGLRIYPNHTDFYPDDPRIRVMNGCLVAVITEDTI